MSVSSAMTPPSGVIHGAAVWLARAIGVVCSHLSGTSNERTSGPSS